MGGGPRRSSTWSVEHIRPSKDEKTPKPPGPEYFLKKVDEKQPTPTTPQNRRLEGRRGREKLSLHRKKNTGKSYLWGETAEKVGRTLSQKDARTFQQKVKPEKRWARKPSKKKGREGNALQYTNQPGETD